MTTNTIPKTCPVCGMDLYGSGAWRPELAMTRRAQALVGVAAIVTAAVFWGGYLLVESLALRIPVLILCLPAVVPGLLIGKFAARLPLVIPLRCSKCRWRARIPF